ncbi:MAG: ATP-binding cassette domain-containing protein, partial [Rhizobiaceae bacterium]|nr:ATP-binding cassette domain-containing protein [Rhizobiaceae bacterium]
MRYPISRKRNRTQDHTPHGFDALQTIRRTGVGSLLALHLARTCLRLGFLAAAAMVVGSLVMGQDVQPWLVVAVPCFLLISAAVGLLADRMQAAAEARAATVVRAAAARRLGEMPAGRVQSLAAGHVVVALRRYPEAIAALVVGHRLAARMMIAGPLTAAGALTLVSWQAALAVLLLTPVMVVFFVLVGDIIHQRTAAQEKAFGHLAGQFADRIRTLPTILACDALSTEEAKLGDRLRTYADRTMAVLRVAFLNAGVIDFFASLSIAMLAVFLGLGHLGLARIPGFSDLALWQSLFILMIAPDYFAPFRRYAEQYHAKAQGNAAAVALDAMLNVQGDASASAARRLPETGPLPTRGLVAVTGPSGAGKTTLLRHLAGLDAPAGSGHPAVAWVATDSFVPGGSLAEAIAWNGGATDRDRVRQVAGQVGLLDAEHLPGGLDARVAADGANLSGGQRLRISAARAL